MLDLIHLSFECDIIIYHGSSKSFALSLALSYKYVNGYGFQIDSILFIQIQP